MRVKLSEKCKEEREDICDKIISILDLDDENAFILLDSDNDTEKQSDILDMKEEIQKCFAVSIISAFKPNFDFTFLLIFILEVGVLNFQRCKRTN